jgi:hypothetical protein
LSEEIAVTEGLHPAAPHHMPWFISGPHEGDPLYVITTLVVIASIVGLGILFFTLHSLPERLGHKKLQFEVVAVLGLLSLFTHVHAFWVAGLLLALVDLPDFVGPLKRMASSLEKLSGVEPLPEDVALAGETDGDTRTASPVAGTDQVSASPSEDKKTLSSSAAAIPPSAAAHPQGV